MLPTFETLKNKVIARFVQQAEAEALVEQASIHAATATQFDDLHSETARTVVRLTTAHEAAHRQAEKLRLPYEAAIAERDQLAREMFHAKHHAFTRGAMLTGRLTQLADPRIEQARRALWERLDKVRNQGDSDEVPRPNKTYGESAFIRRTNGPAIERIVRAAVAAYHELERLKLQRVDDVGAAIAEIESSIPWDDVRRMTSTEPVRA